jgi:hypothetical protein
MLDLATSVEDWTGPAGQAGAEASLYLELDGW